MIVPLAIGRYQDEVLCDVLPIDAGHILLGQPWQFDKRAVYDAYTNKHTFQHQGKKVTLIPMTLQEILEDQLQLKRQRKQLIVSEPLNTKDKYRCE